MQDNDINPLNNRTFVVNDSDWCSIKVVSAKDHDVEAVVIVRCKACQFSEPCDSEGNWYDCMHDHGLVEHCRATDFCSYGIPRDDAKLIPEEELISLSEYARLNRIDPATVRQRALRGAYRTARKIGRNWVIDKNEQHIDHRNKTDKL